MKILKKKTRTGNAVLKVYDREGCTTDWFCGLKTLCI